MRIKFLLDAVKFLVNDIELQGVGIQCIRL